MVAHPFGQDGCTHVEVQLPDSEDVVAAVSWAYENTQASLGTHLEGRCGKDAQLIMSEECPPILPSEEEPPACLGWGMCLCCEDGLKVKRRADKFVKYLKVVLPHGSSRHALLREGHIVARMMGSMASYETNLA